MRKKHVPKTLSAVCIGLLLGMVYPQRVYGEEQKEQPETVLQEAPPKANPQVSQEMIQTAIRYDFTWLAAILRQLKNGQPVDINEPSSKAYQNTALHQAADLGRVDIVQLLLDQGADIEAKNELFATPLHIAVWAGYQDIVELLLLDNKANIEAKYADGISPLHVAVLKGYRSIVELLLDRGASTGAKDNEGWSPLHIAASKGDGCKGNIVMIRLLIKKGADIEATDNEGNTALHTATSQAYIHVIKLLLKKGANIEAKDNEGNTPLCVAVSWGYPSVVKLLIKQGANVAIINQEGDTALMIAQKELNKEPDASIKKGYQTVINLLQNIKNVNS
jgi:ankyrin repeat protein